jgi:alpha-1,6-mannosyltransferase
MSDATSREQCDSPRRKIALLVLLLTLIGCVAVASRFGDFRVPSHARIFVALMFIGGACAIGAAYTIEALRGWRQVLALATVAVVIRAVMLPMEPGDDFWRYLWEGRVQNAGVNPYLVSPSSAELSHLRDARWPQINHPEVAAVYPPLIELLFAGAARSDAAALILKIIFAAADLITAVMLWFLVPLPYRARAVALFASNPAVAYASAGGGHFDSLMVCALTGALLSLHHANRSGFSPLLMWVSASLIGLAVAVKLVPLVLFPLWFWVLRRRWYVFAAPAVILVLPMFLYGGPQIVTGNLRAFTDVARFHDVFWWFVEALTIPNPYQRNWPFILTMSLVIAFVTIRWRDDWARAALWIMGATLILSPVMHPWYATWILPIACWRQQPAWTVFSVSALGALLMWETTGLWTEWQPNWFTRSLVLLPPLLWLVLQRTIQRRTA